jgi:chemotaxis protein CheX
MKIELIQPFINSADAVLAEMLKAIVEINSVSMKEEVYRRKGVAASVTIHGDIEGRIIFDLDPETALQVAGVLAGGEVEPSEELARETVCELANMVVGNAVTLLNDQGFRFKVFAPEVHTTEQGYAGNQETEALVMCFDTPRGKVHMNIAMRYNRRRREDSASAPIS